MQPIPGDLLKSTLSSSSSSSPSANEPLNHKTRTSENVTFFEVSKNNPDSVLQLSSIENLLLEKECNVCTYNKNGTVGNEFKVERFYAQSQQRIVSQMRKYFVYLDQYKDLN